MNPEMLFLPTLFFILFLIFVLCAAKKKRVGKKFGFMKFMARLFVIMMMVGFFKVLEKAGYMDGGALVWIALIPLLFLVSWLIDKLSWLIDKLSLKMRGMGDECKDQDEV